MPELPFDQKIFATNPLYIHFSRNRNRIIIRDDILNRQYYNDVGDISHLQVLQPIQLKDTLLNSLIGEAGNHAGISKMIQEIRQKYYFPSIADHVRKWVEKSEICVQDKRIDNSQITLELISISDWDLGLEDVMQVDLVPKIPPSRGYENIITAFDVFS